MVPLGFEPHFSTGDVVLIAVVVIGFGVLTALPATATLAAVGHRRGGQHRGWNAFWYWLWGTALTLGSVVTFLYLHLSWWSIPLTEFEGFRGGQIPRTEDGSVPQDRGFTTP